MSHALRQSMPNLLAAFHEKFGGNLKLICPETINLLENIDTNLRLLTDLADVLSDKFSKDDLHRSGSANLLRETFSDLCQAMYLSCVGLTVPSRMSIRRAFELGVASLYNWDLPHAYWGWMKCDTDLSFSEMISHLSSSSYGEFLRSQHISSDASTISAKEFQVVYRNLSNTVHGKQQGLVDLSPARFDVNKDYVIKELISLGFVLNLVLKAWEYRMPTFFDSKS